MSLKNFMSYEDASTVLGEYAGAVNSLKSGLTNLDIDMNVPDRKNILPCSLADIKRMNIQGTWDGSVYTYNGVTFTVNTNSAGYVTSIVVTGKSTGNSNIMLVNSNTPNVHLELNGKRVTYSGCPAGGSENTYNLYGWKVTSSASGVRDTGAGVTFDAINMDSSFNFALIIGANYELPSGGLTFYPMLRLASVTDPTFAPYIPSVDARLEAVESNQPVTVISVTADGVKTYAEILEQMKTYFEDGCRFYVDNFVYQQMSPARFCNIIISASSGNVIIQNFLLASGGNTWHKMTLSTSGNSDENISNMVAPSGSVFKIVKNA